MFPILARWRSVSVLRRHNPLPYTILIAYSRTSHFNGSKLNVQQITTSTGSISTTHNTLRYPNPPHPSRNVLQDCINLLPKRVVEYLRAPAPGSPQSHRHHSTAANAYESAASITPVVAAMRSPTPRSIRLFSCYTRFGARVEEIVSTHSSH